MAEEKTMNKEFQQLYEQMLSQYGQTPYPEGMTAEDYQGLYDSIRAGMGDEETLRQNLEAALRPMYQQSVADMQQRRRENNAAIDVDAASRGMGNSTWVTDAKLQQLRGMEQNIANLDANYNNQLFTALQNALDNKDAQAQSLASMLFQQKAADRTAAWQAEQQGKQSAFDQAWTWYQYQHKGGSGSGGGGTATPTGYFDGSQWWPSREAYEQYLGDKYTGATQTAQQSAEDVLKKLQSAPAPRGSNPIKGLYNRVLKKNVAPAGAGSSNPILHE